MPPQSVRFDGHAHAPATHTRPAAHALPQRPQFDASFAVVTQAPSHRTRPAGHAHTPATQVVPAAHAVPHAPQFEESTRVSTHPMDVPQGVNPAGQTLVSTEASGCASSGAESDASKPPSEPAPSMGTAASGPESGPASDTPTPRHTPAEQLCPAAQRRPHAPQCSALVDTLVSQPVRAMPSQSPKPAVQAPSAHAPPLHAAVALANAQRTRHPPQFIVVRRSVSQPFVAVPSQLPKPAVQPVSAHVPPTHEASAFAGAHALPQTPQCAALASRSVSQPFIATPSHSPRSVPLPCFSSAASAGSVTIQRNP